MNGMRSQIWIMDLDAIVGLRMDGKDSMNDEFGVKLLVAA